MAGAGARDVAARGRAALHLAAGADGIGAGRTRVAVHVAELSQRAAAGRLVAAGGATFRGELHVALGPRHTLRAALIPAATGTRRGAAAVVVAARATRVAVTRAVEVAAARVGAGAGRAAAGHRWRGAATGNEQQRQEQEGSRRHRKAVSVMRVVHCNDRAHGKAAKLHSLAPTLQRGRAAPEACEPQHLRCSAHKSEPPRRRPRLLEQSRRPAARTRRSRLLNRQKAGRQTAC